MEKRQRHNHFQHNWITSHHKHISTWRQELSMVAQEKNREFRMVRNVFLYERCRETSETQGTTSLLEDRVHDWRGINWVRCFQFNVHKRSWLHMTDVKRYRIELAHNDNDLITTINYHLEQCFKLTLRSGVP